MPTGVPIKDHLGDPDFKFRYATLKYSNLKDTDFAPVATYMGVKDATFAWAIFHPRHICPHFKLTAYH
jgi:hypothetical protein